jgi:outer membrane protein TolC
MKRFAALITVTVFLAASVLYAEEITLSLDEAIAIALRDNPDVVLKTEDIRKAKAKLAEAHSGLFPEINLQGGWNNTRGFYTRDISQIDSNVQLKWYLYRGGGTINTIKSGEAGIEVTRALLDKAKLDTVFNVQGAFYTLLLADNFASLNKEILRNTQAHLEYLQARYQNGQSSQSEIISIKSSLANVEEAYQASLNQIEASSSLLKNLLHLEDRISLKAKGGFEYEPKEVAYDEAMLQAMRSRPEIRQFEAQEKQAKSGVEIAKAGGRPTIYASWDYFSASRQTGQFSPDPVKGWSDFNIIGVTFSWPIFDGWATKARVDQALVDLKEAEILKDKVKRDIVLELKNAYLGLKNSVSMIKSAESDLALYQDTLNVSTEKFKNGIASSLGLDDARLGFNVASFNQKQAVYEYIIAKNNFERATGGK